MTDSRDPVDAIKRLYYQATKATILRDLDRAIDLLKALPDEDTRARAAVYMDGLAQMRSEWGVKAAAAVRPAAKAPARPARRPAR
ncbi:MAG: hypothetical protein U0P30_14770 [Vicinamibacterales bacterium]